MNDIDMLFFSLSLETCRRDFFLFRKDIQLKFDLAVGEVEKLEDRRDQFVVP